MKVNFKYSVGDAVYVKDIPTPFTIEKSFLNELGKAVYQMKGNEYLIFEESELKKEKIKYIITPEMQDLIDSFKAIGYKVNVTSGKWVFYGYYGRPNVKCYRYATEISIDGYNEEGSPYCFLFSPSGEKILDYGYNSEYCEPAE